MLERTPMESGLVAACTRRMVVRVNREIRLEVMS
jgi:hypothetical protein